MKLNRLATAAIAAAATRGAARADAAASRTAPALMPALLASLALAAAPCLAALCGAEHLAGILQKPILRSDLYRSLQAITGTNLPETPVAAAPPHPGAARRRNPFRSSS